MIEHSTCGSTSSLLETVLQMEASRTAQLTTFCFVVSDPHIPRSATRALGSYGTLHVTRSLHATSTTRTLRRERTDMLLSLPISRAHLITEDVPLPEHVHQRKRGPDRVRCIKGTEVYI